MQPAPATLEQLQVDAYRQAADVAAARVAADEQEIRTLTGRIATAQQAIDAKRRIVRTQAILTYINAGSAGSGVAGALFTDASGDRAQAASEYADLAAGTITTAIAQLHTAQADLQDQEGALHQRQARDRADQSARATALAQATTTAADLSDQQARVTGQLAAAVAAQQAAAARSATVAVATRAAAPAATPARSAPVATVPTAGPGTAPTPPVARPVGNPAVGDPPLPPFLQCVVQAESGGDYTIASPGGTYMGAFQFSQPTWNTAAQAAGLTYLVGVPPNAASKAEQDTVAVTLYTLDGRQPWLGDRCSA